MTSHTATLLLPMNWKNGSHWTDPLLLSRVELYTNVPLVTDGRLEQVNAKKREREREMFYLTTHSTHFIYGYMASDIWLRTILIVRKETRCRYIGYSFRLTARVLLYAPSHSRIKHTTAFVTPVVEHWLEREIAQWVHPMKDRSDDPSHHERTLYL